jgi:3,4-dihydroxy 2-butanone 4-phosphate synthase/GTP cyclohydrolase II
MMTQRNGSKFGTNFTVSIEAAEGVTTGISAADRARTVQAAVAPNAKAADLVQPGHIFPLMAQPGGVLVRAGHTEAGCDLARLAGAAPAAVIVEILNEDGSMARRPDLEVFAEKHDLKMGTIADLIHYRVSNEHTIERLNECRLPTAHGDFRLVAYQDIIDSELHLALVMGEPDPEEPTLVRVHMQNSLCDLFATQGCDCGLPLEKAMAQVARAGKGVIVVLRNHDSAKEIVQRISEFEQQSVPERPSEAGKVLRTYGAGAQILADLGVRKLRIISAPKSLQGLSGFDMEVVEYVEPEH